MQLDVLETELEIDRYHDEGCPHHVDTERDVIASYGYDVDTTPIDRLGRDDNMGLAVAWNMEHGDEAYPE